MAWKNVQYENGKYRTGSGGGGSSTFADLEDVDLSNLQDGQVPKYNSSTQKWENANESGGSGGLNYSETEHIIGTWITGKPLYEKTVVYTTPVTIQNGSWYTSPETYPNCQLVCGEVLNAAFGYYPGVIIVIENDHLIVGNQTKNQPINNMKYVTLRYIKTTD